MAWEELRVYLPGRPGNGRAVIEVDFDDGVGERSSAGPYLTRTGRTRLNERVVQRLLIDSADREARSRLGVEVEIGEHLWRSWPTTHYPDQLCQLVGSDLDTKPPFVLVTRRGEPLPEAGLKPRIAGQQAVAVIDGVIRGLLRLHQAGVVCRAVSPETLLWDGRALQFGYFGAAAFRDRELTGSLSAAPLPWRAPDPPTGLPRHADPKDDLYSGALVLFWLLTGERPGSWSEPPLNDPVMIAVATRDRLEPESGLTRYDESVRKLLGGAFCRNAVDRVDSYDLAQKLRTYGLPRPDIVVSSGWDRTERKATESYRAEFRHLLARQRSFLASQAPRPVPPASPRTGRIPPVPAAARPADGSEVRQRASGDLIRRSPIRPAVVVGALIFVLLSVIVGVIIL